MPFRARIRLGETTLAEAREWAPVALSIFLFTAGVISLVNAALAWGPGAPPDGLYTEPMRPLTQQPSSSPQAWLSLDLLRSDPFRADRGPAAKSVIEEPAVPGFALEESATAYTLVGTVVTDGGSAFAVLARAGAGSRLLRPGERWDDLELVQVSRGRILTRLGGRRLELGIPGAQP